MDYILINIIIDKKYSNLFDNILKELAFTSKKSDNISATYENVMLKHTKGIYNRQIANKIDKRLMNSRKLIIL